MTLTGQLGSSESQPGAVQPGYFSTGIAVWEGPFPDPQIAGYHVIPGAHGQVTVPLAVASQLATSDPTWWTFH